MSDEIYTLNLKPLDKIYKALKNSKTSAKVGILGNKNHRHDGGSIEKSGMFSDDMIKEIIKTGELTKYVEKVGIAGVSVVLQAFDSGGFGTWKSLNEKTLKYKKVKQILIETHQLRDSISYEVK